MSSEPNEFRVTDVREIHEFNLLSISYRGEMEFTAEHLRELDEYIAENCVPFSREIGSATGNLQFWTSSRGDHWELREAASAEDAAKQQAQRWADMGYRGPWTIMVSLSGVTSPPKSGDRIYAYEVVPQVSFEARRIEFKDLL